LVGGGWRCGVRGCLCLVCGRGGGSSCHNSITVPAVVARTAAEDRPGIFPVQRQAERLQEMVGSKGFRLACHSRREFGKLIENLVGLWSPSASVGFCDERDEGDPLLLAQVMRV